MHSNNFIFSDTHWCMCKHRQKEFIACSLLNVMMEYDNNFIRKVYVESPIFMREDEETYKYVDLDETGEPHKPASGWYLHQNEEHVDDDEEDDSSDSGKDEILQINIILLISSESLPPSSFILKTSISSMLG